MRKLHHYDQHYNCTFSALQRALKQLGRIEETSGNLTGAQHYYSVLLESSTGIALPESADVRMKAHRLLAVAQLGIGDHNAALNHLEQSLGLAASLNRYAEEAENRFVKSVLHWSLGHSKEAKDEIEKTLRVSEKSAYTTFSGDPLEVGRCSSTAESALALQMCIFAENLQIKEALLSAEQIRFRRRVESFEREGAKSQRYQRQYLPTPESMTEELSRLQNNQETFLSCFQIFDQFLLTWFIRPDEALKLIITRVDSSTLGSSGASLHAGESLAPFSWKLESPALQNVLENRLAQIVAAREAPNISTSFSDAEILAAVILKPFRQDLDGAEKLAITLDSSLLNETFCKALRLVVPNCDARFLPSLIAPTAIPIIPSISDSLSIAPSSEVLSIVSTKSKTRENAELHKDIILQKLPYSPVVNIKATLFHAKDIGTGFALQDTIVDTIPSEDDIILMEDILSVDLSSVDLLLMVYPSQIDYFAWKRYLEAASNFLIAGIKSILLIRENSNSEYFSQTLFSEFRRGIDVTSAIESAMDTASFDGELFLIGKNSKIQRDSSLPLAIRSLLKTPDECREALRVILHLVEKSLQRIHAGQQNPMYTSEKSIKNKVGPEVQGWLQFLLALGFTENKSSSTDPSANREPSLYFPGAQHTQILSEASQTLQALLGLPQNSVAALSRIIEAVGSADTVSKLVKQFESWSHSLAKTAAAQFETSFPRALYEATGVSSLVASMGFDKIRDGNDVVIVKTIRMELTRRKVEYGIRVLHAVFDDILSTHKLSDDKVTNPAEGNQSPISSAESRMNRLNLRDLEVTDVESDFYGRETRPASFKSSSTQNGEQFLLDVTPSRQKRGSRRSGPSNGTKETSSGYMSESELKHSRRRAKQDLRGYFSEDESKAKKRSATNRDPSSAQRQNIDFFETTARVISVEERTSPMSNEFADFTQILPIKNSGHRENGNSGIYSLKSASPVAHLTKNPVSSIRNGSPRLIKRETPSPVPSGSSPVNLGNRVRVAPPPPPYRPPSASYLQMKNTVEQQISAMHSPTPSSEGQKDAAQLRTAALRVLTPRKVAAGPYGTVVLPQMTHKTTQEIYLEPRSLVSNTGPYRRFTPPTKQQQGQAPRVLASNYGDYAVHTINGGGGHTNGQHNLAVLQD